MYQEGFFHCNFALFPVVRSVRYWIYWNDLVQGPFELEELTSLHAFSEELPVCMEGRDEWLPAARVADLAPAIELLRSRRVPPPPPPPPPSRPPSLDPVQGEFFGEVAGQQHLFEGSDDDRKGPYSYSPSAPLATVDPEAALYTTPIRFRTSGDFSPAAPAVQPKLAPRPAIDPIPQPLPKPVIKPPEPLKETPRFEILEAPPPLPETPAPLPKTPRPTRESPIRKEIPVEIEKVAAQAPIELPPVPVDAFPEAPPAELPRISLPEVDPFEVETSQKRKAPEIRLLPWVGGFVLAIGLLGTLSYWAIDRFTSKAAIAEVARFSGRKAEPIVAPVTAPPPPPVPVPVAVVEAPRTPVVASIARKPKPIRKAAIPIAKPKPAPVVAKPVVPPPAPPVVPGLADPAPTPAEAAKWTPAPDPWIGRQNDAIQTVMDRKIFSGKKTIGAHAKSMLLSMHEKELLHAAETGERLYLPDKSSWAALREDGSVYRVYLNFSALQANGERVQTRSYQFRVDLKSKETTTDDNATRHDFFDGATAPAFEHQMMAEDIDQILSGIDLLNKQKMAQMILKRNRHSKKELKNNDQAVLAAQARVQRAIVYFRTRYPEKALQNIAQAYGFTSVLKSNG